jgi:signal transduction histidine kinase
MREKRNQAQACHAAGGQICVFKNYGFAFSVGLMALAACLALSNLAKPWLRAQVLERELQEAASNQHAFVDSISKWFTSMQIDLEFEELVQRLTSVAATFYLPSQTSIEILMPSGRAVKHDQSIYSTEDFELGVFEELSSQELLSFEDLKRKNHFTGYFIEADSMVRQILVWRRMQSGFCLASFQAQVSVEKRVSGAYALISATATVASIVLGCSVFVIVTVQSRRYQRRIDQTMYELAEALDTNLIQNKSLEQQAIQLKKLLTEIQDLNRILVHDLKTPIGNIESLLNLVEETDVRDDTTRKRFLEMMKTSCAHATSLIEGILEIHQLEKDPGDIQLGEVELNRLVQDIASSYEEAARVKNITLSIVTEKGSFELRSEEQWLGSLLGNLVSNAVKYTQRGGEVRIVTEKEGEKTLVSIQDQGPGFSEKDQSRMFYKFQTLSAQPTGDESSHGLGLYAVKKPADRLGVEIDFKTVLGVGTTFLIRLPHV